MISCYENVTQHIPGQPFYNMSMEALEMMIKSFKDILCCRLAKSGEASMGCSGEAGYKLKLVAQRKFGSSAIYPSLRGTNTPLGHGPGALIIWRRLIYGCSQG